MPTNVSNHLTTGLLKYLETTGRYASGINLFEKLRTQSIEVSSLLAKVLFMGNEEVAGVKALYQSLQETPMDYVMLDTQAEFLLKKAHTADTPEAKEERLRMAQGCADRSTIAAPSEFGTWARLAQIYVSMEDWENALTTLNSCPMFTYQDKDTPIMPEPKEVHLPILPETRLDEIDSEPESRFLEQVDPSLLGLRAAGYRGTFKQAYSILTEMTAKIGWDQLLKIRSNVFVMEDEYRTEKQEASHPALSKRSPSMDGLRGTPDPTANGAEESNGDKGATDKAEEPAEAETAGEKPATNGDSNGDSNGESNGDSNGESNGDSNGESNGDSNGEGNGEGNGEDNGEDNGESNGKSNGLEKPSNTIDPQEVKADTDPVSRHEDPTSHGPGKLTTKQSTSNDENLSKLNTKRLCERWLDSLFMVLYEDLRVYTIWRTQMAQYRAQQMQYKKSAEEWEILGALAERLQHLDEAVEAYRACLSLRFSPKALAGVLRVFEKTKSTRETVASVIRLVTWQYRWYSEFSPELLHTIRTLIEDEGAVKVRSIIQATSLPQNVLDLTHHYAALCATFRSSGTDG